MKKEILYLIIVMALSSCTKKIDINLDEDYKRLVVYGEITNEKQVHSIELSETTDFFDEEPAKRISDAIVIVDDGFSQDTLQESAVAAGVYETTADYEGIPGRTYTLRIELPENIGGNRIYTSECRMPPVRILDSIHVVYKDRWEAWEVQCYAYEPETVDFYRFDTYLNGVHNTDTIDEPFTSEDILFNGQYTNGIAIGYFQEENGTELVEIGDTITARIGSITEAYYLFLVDVYDESGYNSPLFDGPPANIRGNISDDGIGFFAAFSVDYATTTYDGDVID